MRSINEDWAALSIQISALSICSFVTVLKCVVCIHNMHDRFKKVNHNLPTCCSITVADDGNSSSCFSGRSRCADPFLLDDVEHELVRYGRGHHK